MIRIADVARLSRAGQLELSARRVVEGLYAGRHRSPQLGPASEFADHRPYVPGDDLRSIDWRAFARSDHLLVRRYREERDLPLVLALDTSASMEYGEPPKSRWATLAAAALGLLACDQGDRVRLCSPGALGPERGGPAGATALCDELSRLRFAGAGDGAALLEEAGRRLERRSLVVLLGDLLAEPEPLARAAGALAARGHEVAALQVLDASELALPADWGRSTLEDPEGSVAPLGCDAAEMKTAYDAAMRDHRLRLGRTLAAARAELVAAPTAQEPAAVLGGWLQRRSRR